MLRQMIAAHERLGTFAANEFLFARMCSLVAAEFVASGKLAIAIGPSAQEWLFTSCKRKEKNH